LVPRTVCGVTGKLADGVRDRVDGARVHIGAGCDALLVGSVDEETTCASRSRAGALAVLVAGIGCVRDLRQREGAGGEALWVGSGHVVGEEPR
jgi:hypothetical protein